MKLQNKKTISVISLLIIIALLIYYINKNEESFATLTLTNPLLLVVLVILFVIGYILTSILNNELLKALNVRMSLSESFALSIITGFYNLITPFRGGIAARAMYLKNKYNFAYVHFLAILSAVYVLIFLVASILGIVSALLIYSTTGLISWSIFYLLLAVFLSFLIITFMSPTLPESRNKWINRFVKVINGWHEIKKNKRVIFITLIITLIQTLVSSLMLYLQFRVFGIEIPFIQTIFLSSIGSLGILVAITPAGLGISEAITVFSAITIGITPAQSLSATLLGRAVSFIVLFILGPIFSYALLKKGRNE
ncbi:flippase-like domain-containing protein [Candidatus Woesearchaeota archaeon]|nr:flippase-like domain-containing protein [Candidatus Woesearchaeota archaeon]